MGEAKRRRAVGEVWPSPDELGRAAQQMAADSGGIWDAYFYPFSEVRNIIDAAVSGNREASPIARGILRMYEAACSDSRPVCLTCDAEFSGDKGPAFFVFVRPQVESPKNAFLNGICAKCASRGDQSMADAAADAYRRMMLPDLRRIKISSATGHA
jgi:hypothetical protein